MDFWAEKFPEHVININYEDLVTSPEKVGQSLFNFCNVEWKNEYLNFYQQNISSFTFSEIQVRQKINTKKVNFSDHYKERLTEFNQVYNKLSLKEI
jgi:hypothetical protein